MKFTKKGQAALEFLTTYGWAFLVILVMIGALSYFGVFDVGKFVPDSCKLDGTIECPAYALDVVAGDADASSVLSLAIQNQVGGDITVTDMRIKEIEAADWCNCTIAAGVPVNGRSTQADVSCTSVTDGTGNCGLFDGATGASTVSGEKLRFDIEVYYQKDGSTINNVASGSLTTTVR